jgi:hypothetical protein
MALDRALERLMNQKEETAEYDKILSQIIRLHKMKEEEKPSRVNPDTWVMAGANLIGILLIINHEYAHPLTSRAMSLIRLR